MDSTPLASTQISSFLHGDPDQLFARLGEEAFIQRTVFMWARAETDEEEKPPEGLIGHHREFPSYAAFVERALAEKAEAA